MKKFFYTCFLMIGFSLMAFSQDTLKKAPSSSSEKSISKKAKAVEESLKENNPEATALQYEDLAKSLIEKGDYARAEDYLKRALDIYKKKKDRSKIASVSRSLAQVQESQNKFDDAITNYKAAGKETSKDAEIRLNTNDMNRLQNTARPEVQAEYLDSNIQILEETGNTAEVITAYKQKAEAELLSDKKSAALESYEKALSVSKDKPGEALKIKSEISKVYEAGGRIDDAIEVTGIALDEAIKLNDISQELIHKRELALLMHKSNNDDQALSLLAESYETALKYGKTSEAKAAVTALSEILSKSGKAQKSLEWHQRFLDDFEQLIRADSSLVDTKIFEVTEEKIKQLEKEKALQEQLIVKKNRFNYVLIGSVLLMLVLLGFIVKALYAIKNKNKKIALQSLRREMNPHFIFNSLNSVNQFIARNDELEANKYLTSYSNLMRKMMETSNKDFIPLSAETEQIQKYLSLEHLRFQDKFDYKITVAENLDTDALLVPNMLIQPHLENAVWHGLRYIPEKGFLNVVFSDENSFLKVTIEDNGIGITESEKLKTKNQKLHQSRGLNNVRERIQLLNDLYRQNISFTIGPGTDGAGTKVELFFEKITHLNNE